MAATLFKRTVIDEIGRYLYTDDVIVIHGARQVGKTSILAYLQGQLREQGETTFYLDLEDSRLVSILDKGVDEFLNHLREEGLDLDGAIRSGKKLFVFIDEIQYLTNPSPFLKLLADHQRYLKMIVSGSSSFEMKSKFRVSLVGRTVNFEIYPLSFREFLLFKGVTFVEGAKFTGKKIVELQSLYAEYGLCGGDPKIVLTPGLSLKEKYLQQIIDTYVRKDIRDLAEVKDISKFNRLLEILASQSGNMLTISELSNTCALARQTVERYLFLLEQTYVIRLVRPFSRNVRSELSKAPKVFFYDTGLMQMLWLKRLQKELLGPVFETSIFAELVKCYGPGQISYWRTLDKKEIDFIIRLPEGILPIEAKIQFPRAIPSALRGFIRPKSAVQSPNIENDYRIVSLYGQPATDKMIYPWQL